MSISSVPLCHHKKEFELSAECHFQPLPMSKGLVMAVRTVKRLEARTSWQRLRAANNDTTPVIWLGDDKHISKYLWILTREGYERDFKQRFQASQAIPGTCMKLHTFAPTFVSTSTDTDTSTVVLLQSEDENNLSWDWIPPEDISVTCLHEQLVVNVCSLSRARRLTSFYTTSPPSQTMYWAQFKYPSSRSTYVAYKRCFYKGWFLLKPEHCII